MADLDHVVMAVEMHALSGSAAAVAGDEVPAREFLAVARRAVGTDQLAVPALRTQPGLQVFADLAIQAARRVQRRNADQVLRQADQIVAAVFYLKAKRVHGVRLGRVRLRGNGVIDTNVPQAFHGTGFATKVPLMIAFLRLIGMVLIVELIFYALLSIYIRSLRREDLEKEWDRRHPERAGPSPERGEFVRRSMVGFNKTLQARLVALVLFLPVVAIIVIIVIVNYN